ncbi:hypothetical protein SCHPADRAFT_52855 [Schizopora paradoxa]|uniref:Uncharacterized protein n=1 Tax=Schizopora paradoxa TaxID=27342 RepID=A0A0H2SD21_9AGAM|nr:hypothetical protein SCHPADRAFT_52855 [Schizopora paradoxa]
MGYALYDPDPRPGDDVVRVGDVGYIRHGRFERFASVFQSDCGIPAAKEEYRQVDPFTGIDKGILSSESVRSNKVKVGISANEVASGSSAGWLFSITSESDCGASLITRYRATIDRARHYPALEQHFAAYTLSYFDVAQSRMLPVKRLNDIILVTGRVMTGDWATLAFRRESQEFEGSMSFSFNSGAITLNGSASIWGKWDENVNFPKRHGPTRPQVIRDEEEPHFDQCIFIETLRGMPRSWYEKVLIQIRYHYPTHHKSKTRVSKHLEGAQNLEASGSSNLEQSNPIPSSSKMVTSQVEISPNDFQNVFTSYEVMAFLAFQIASANFDLIMIDERDVNHYLPVHVYYDEWSHIYRALQWTSGF